MKSKRIFFSWIILILLLILMPAPLQAQEKGPYSLSGFIIDSVSRQPVEYASVALYREAGKTLITGTLTNPQGKFVFPNISSGNYFLRCSFVGYKESILTVTIVNKPVQLIQPVILAGSTVAIDAVSITGKQGEKQVSIEKTRINVGQNIGAASGNVTDILKSQPAISIDSDERVYLRGNSNILILVDGKPSTISSLNAIPASATSSIEIITNPDARYDSEGTGGIINIVTKQSGRSGLNGSLTLNYGWPNRLNGGLDIGYRKENWDIGFNYSGRREQNTIHSKLTREVPSLASKIIQDILTSQTNTNQSAALTVSFRPTSKDQFMISTRIGTPEVSNSQQIMGIQISDGLPDSGFNRLNDVKWLRQTFEGTATYRKTFSKNRHELSADLLFSRNKGYRPANYFIDGQWLQKSEAGGAPTNMSAQIDYFKQLPVTGRIEGGIKTFARMNDFDSDFFDLDTLTAMWIHNTIYSNDLDHKEFIGSGYFMYADSLFNKIYFKAGARLEYNSSELIQHTSADSLSRSWFFPFPYLQLKYALSKESSLAISLNRRITRPTYYQLNPFIVVVDQLTYETGNKLLNPEIQDKAEVNYSLIKEKFQLRSNLFFSHTRDFITQVSILTDDNSLMVTFVNGDRQLRAGADLDATLRLNTMLSLNSALSLFYTSSNGIYGSTDLFAQGVAWTANLKATLKPFKFSEVQMLFNYNSPVDLPQFRLDKIWYTDIAFRQSLLKNKMTISLTLADVFNSRKWIIESDNSHFRLFNESKTDTRIIWLGLSYNLSNLSSRKASKNENAEEEGRLIKLGL